MNILDMIKRDHKTVSFLFNRLAESPDLAAKKKSELFEVLKEELEVHSDLEESVFYPAIKEEAPDLIGEALKEHAVVADLLRELEAEPVNSPQWEDKLHDLAKQVEHHVQEEESEFFTRAREYMDVQELDELGKTAQRHREELFALK
jgi:hemerythrin superfamily protein